MRLIVAITLWLALATGVYAEDVVLGMSSDQVSINTNFDGSEILIFGAIKREEPIPGGNPVEVIVTVAGPSEPITVRRKEKRLGIWVNTDSVEVDAAPSFYAVATSALLGLSLNDTEDLRYRISIPRAIRSVGAPMDIADPGDFTQALIRIKERDNQYQVVEGAVNVDQQTLFRTAIKLPAALTEGTYKTRIFLTRNGEVIANHETSIYVRKVGLERWLFRLSRDNAVVYGLMSLAIAIAAGWLASAVFTVFRR